VEVISTVLVNNLVFHRNNELLFQYDVGKILHSNTLGYSNTITVSPENK